MFDMACVADIFQAGGRATERVSERAWGEQTTGRSGERVNKNGEREGGGEDKEVIYNFTPWGTLNAPLICNEQLE